MKYPLAVVDRLLELYGSDIGLTYDIMCAFIKTLEKSSLGAKMVGLRLHGVVPAFHGHAHNRACQVLWHPLYIQGAGLEDFEECERTFSKSNELAGVTRLATPFHRHQQMDEHFFFHDEDKHASSGKLKTASVHFMMIAMTL
jgi:Kyakuja-Dileera-Zisupton transposase